MLLQAQALMELVQAAVNIRNQCKLAVAAKDNLIPMPATAATASAPARPAWTKPTGQLMNAANNAFVVANNLIGQMRLIGADDALVKQAEALLNAPAAAPTPGTPATAAPSATTATAAAATTAPATAKVAAK